RLSISFENMLRRRMMNVRATEEEAASAKVTHSLWSCGGAQVMVEIARQWRHEIERGPNLLIIRLFADDVGPDGFADLADSLWNVLEQHFTYRAVVDCSGIASVTRELIDQFIELGDRIASAGGMLRLCGLSKRDLRQLREEEIYGRFACYPTCAEAINESPRKPR